MLHVARRCVPVLSILGSRSQTLASRPWYPTHRPIIYIIAIILLTSSRPRGSHPSSSIVRLRSSISVTMTNTIRAGVSSRTRVRPTNNLTVRTLSSTVARLCSCHRELLASVVTSPIWWPLKLSNRLMPNIRPILAATRDAVLARHPATLPV